MTPEGRENALRLEQAQKRRCKECSAKLRALRNGAKKDYCDPCAQKIKRKTGRELEDEGTSERGKGRPPQRYCPQGHDTWETGRYDAGSCRACMIVRKEKRSKVKRSERVYLYGLAELRYQSGMTSKGLSQKSGVENTSLRSYEQIKYTCAPDKALAIANALGVSVEELKGEG
jgi:ribosome-binding protein aMBF1 (putative translation factor)